MNSEIYQIGDVANIVGVSRDTLRYYEKRGLISPYKEKNGYRYYNESDIQKLISILYQRNMDLSLNDIETYWSSDDSHAKIAERIARRIQEEEEEIRRHQQIIARLNLTLSEYAHFENHCETVSLDSFPAAHVIIPQAAMQESVELWFQYSRKYRGLDMMYIYDEYSWQRQNNRISMEYKNSLLLLHDELTSFVDYDVSREAVFVPASRFFVTTTCFSPTRIPDASLLLPMLDWASSQELIVSQQLFATFSSQGMQEGKTGWFLRLFIPVC